MAVAQCPDPKSLQRFLLGQLPANTAATLESHVLACPRCAKVLPTLAADDTLVEAMRTRAKAGLPQHEKDLLDGLMMRLQKQRPRPGGDNTVTGENTMPHAPADDDSRALTAFLAPAQADDELGRLGHYRVLKILGHGGMGVVFQAEDAHLKRSVAVKAMLPEVAKKSTARERFLREARAAAGLEHDHVVTVHHVGEERGVPFMVMPMLKGSSLEDFIKKKPNLTTGQILKVGREIARGLAAAHEVGLIHRDIKPGNIWLDATAGGRVKILDFGLARSGTDDHITQAGLIVGTAAYMAPEQARGEEVDGRADLFSLGVILYRLCTGQTPWKGSDAVSTLLLAATEPATPVTQLNPNVPPALADLIMQLLGKKPEERPISARSVADDLAKIERGLKAATVPVATAVQPAADVAAFQSLMSDGQTVALPKKQPSRWRWKLVGAFLIAGCSIALAVVFIQTDKGILKIETAGEQVAVVIEKDGKVVKVIDTKGGGEVQLESGDYQLKLAKSEMFVEVKPDHFVMKRGEVLLAKVTRLPDDRPLPPSVQPPPPPPVRRVPETTVADKPGEVRRFDGHTDDVRLVAFAPNGKHLVSVSKDKTLRLWDVATGQQLKTVVCPTGIQNTLAISPDGRQVLVGMYSKLLWCDLESGALSTEDLGVANVYASYSPDGLRAACAVSAPSEKRVILWDPATRKETSRFELEMSYSHPTFIAKGRQLLLIRASGPGAVFDVQTGKLVRSFSQWVGTGVRMALSPDERRLISIDSGKRAGLGDFVNGTHLRPFAEGVSSAAFSPDSRTVATGEADGAVVLREAESGKELHRFVGHTANVASVAFSPDGQTAVSGSYDKTIRLWRMPKPGSAAPELDPWTKSVQALPPEKQVEAVAAKLKELNPGFDGKLSHRIEGNAVTRISLLTDHVRDVAPLRAVSGLSNIEFNATKFDSGVLADLSPLQGLRLTRFHCARSRVTDLAPLRGMRLTSLLLERNPVVDLTPVAGMPLTYLNLDYTQVADLTPLRGMPLKSLICNHTRVTDLTPIKGMPLEDIACHIQPARDLEILRSLPNLRLINGKPAAEFWQQHDPKHAAFLEWTEATKKLPAEEQIKAVAAKMQELNPGFDGQLQPTLVNDRVSGVKFACDAVTNLAPLRALSDLRDLQCSGSASGKGRLRDLGPLQGLQLWKLFAGWSRIDDLSPLANMPLTYVNLGGTQVSDLTPLGEVKTLQTLMINNTRVNDLGPVKGSRALTYLNCTETPVADFTPLRDAPLNDLYAKPETVTRQADVLRTIKTLTTINDKPAATFWKELDAAKP